MLCRRVFLNRADVAPVAVAVLEFLNAKPSESFRNFLENSVLNPKRAELNPKSEIWAHMGPARALEESVGPARALEKRKKIGKTHPVFKHISIKNGF